MSGYHGQARVENAFFRYKSIIGAEPSSVQPREGGRTEVVLACNILNQMTGLGRPMSYAHRSVKESVGTGIALRV